MTVSPGFRSASLATLALLILPACGRDTDSPDTLERNPPNPDLVIPPEIPPTDTALEEIDPGLPGGLRNRLSGSLGELRDDLLEQGDELAQRATEVTGAARDQGFDLLEAGGERFNQLRNEASGEFSQLSDEGEVMFRDLGEDLVVLLREGKEVTIDAGESLSEELVRIGMDRETQTRFIQVGAKLIPIYGPAEKYLEARELYEKGTIENDDAVQTEAKKRCLVSLGELGLDLTLFGSSELTGGVESAVETLKVVKATGTATELDMELLGPVAEKALAHKRVDNATVFLLTVEHPEQMILEIFLGRTKDAPPSPALLTAPDGNM